MKVFIKNAGELSEIELPENAKLKDFIEKMDIKDNLVVRNGEILSETDDLSENDTLRLVPIVSGG
ncbi:MoaD/ThiS family protein [Methanococcus maripaludis]|uniref:Sulfur carrier protein n=2 Tax=Methanococcus maripaludis TaxID=39152 RepID=Q6LZH3_METMP|nr:MoaD/ThiS family protein [Methanococcus maripaludis]MBA2846504.1 sulfur carrier protein [Methanococcus maripaludis]MBA2850936.1 sulfur carrier protein [Methanococcus maripaludis]MBA2858439.1 sulfur carrier protein [Methanococcus maripaludis]MBB6067753.1 sulfur carrier protein [Methanococcus maripaludis]MBM7408641.1 sulfur carrier protein [Methanococcus maripaludis]